MKKAPSKKGGNNMAKKDLKEATKAATVGMFTPKTSQNNLEQSEQKKDDITNKESDTSSMKAEKNALPKQKKRANDYLYLDLRPAGGADLKAYIMEQAHRTSMEQGRNVSATNYIQTLIKSDMDSKKDNTTKSKIMSLLNNTTEEKLETIYTIIKNII